MVQNQNIFLFNIAVIGHKIFGFTRCCQNLSVVQRKVELLTDDSADILGPVPSIISFVISNPAILAVIRDTKQPEMKARNATFVIEGRFSGARALKAPIMIPIELGFAKPQIAYVAIAADRSCKQKDQIVFS